MNTAVLTSVRNDRLFLKKWVDWYGGNFGRENLFVMLDGHDQTLPEGCEGVNVLRLPHRDWAAEVASVPLRRVVMEHHRSRAMSEIARGLFRYDFGAVIATDVDEFLVADPARHENLAAFVASHRARTSSLSGLGLDVVQALGREEAIDAGRPFLDQRSVAVISNAYTKPVLAFRPVTWGAGLHRIKGRNFHIHPDLFVLHFGMIDYQTAMGRASDANLIRSGWGPHMQRREDLYRLVEAASPEEGEAPLLAARRRLSWRRKILAWNKPAPLPGPPVIRLPARFAGLL